MDRDKLAAILNMVATGKLPVDGALSQLRNLPYEDIGFAKVDNHRSLRQGVAEVIYSPGKTAEQIAQIAERLRINHRVVLASRATPEQARIVLQHQPDAIYHELSGMLVFGRLPEPSDSIPAIAVVTAGTADRPVAEEASIVLQSAAAPIIHIQDVGVAGIHRLLDNISHLQSAAATIVVAGMDGALPSVVAGLLEGPVIAVPTSVGYGASLQGFAPLLTMLNSCAAGLTVVNIDNGFGAAMAALRAVSLARKYQSS